MSSVRNQMLQMNTASLRQALTITSMKRSMNQDAQSMEMVKKMMEQSVTPSKGKNLDTYF